jgi:hypothetical protein
MQDGLVDFSPRCEDCAALCCVMLPFDAGAAFGFDKAGGVPCQHLAGHLCAVHDGLDAAGFSGCRRYDCQGAGQRVVQEVFAGQSWRRDPALLAPMEVAFAAMRRLHEDYGLLNACTRLPLTGAEQALRHSLMTEQNIGARQTEASLRAYQTGPLPRRVRDFVAGLKARLTPRR